MAQIHCYTAPMSLSTGRVPAVLGVSGFALLPLQLVSAARVGYRIRVDPPTGTRRSRGADDHAAAELHVVYEYSCHECNGAR
jgi:hypothetical protein